MRRRTAILGALLALLAACGGGGSNRVSSVRSTSTTEGASTTSTAPDVSTSAPSSTTAPSTTTTAVPCRSPYPPGARYDEELSMFANGWQSLLAWPTTDVWPPPMDTDGDGQPDRMEQDTPYYPPLYVTIHRATGDVQLHGEADARLDGTFNVGDLDGDGRTDLSVTEDATPRTTYLVRIPPGPGSYDVATIGTALPDPAWPTAVGDQDGDGGWDLLVSSSFYSGRALLKAGVGGRDLTWPPPLRTFPTTADARLMGGMILDATRPSPVVVHRVGTSVQLTADRPASTVELLVGTYPDEATAREVIKSSELLPVRERDGRRLLIFGVSGYTGHHAFDVRWNIDDPCLKLPANEPGTYPKD